MRNSQKGFLAFLLVLAASLAVSSAGAETITKLLLSKQGIKTVRCPAYIGNPSSGLSTSVLTYAPTRYGKIEEKKTLCVQKASLAKVRKVSKYIEPQTLSMSGFQTGTPFTPVVDQEGDVNTDPFQIINYPAMIYYSVSNATFSTEFSIDVIDLQTNSSREKLLRGKEEVSGKFAFNRPGNYYLKIKNKADAAQQTQPVFSVWMEYMEPYEGTSFLRQDVNDAGIRTLKKCPKMIDIVPRKLISPVRGMVCSSAVDLEEAGALPAPLNAATQILMATEIDWAEGGGSSTFPFRISGPTTITYSVQDPTDGRGSFSLRLMDLVTGREVTPTLASVKGSIQETTTFINIPGDYYIFGDTDPYDAKENGDIFWTVSLQAAH